jgi:uncharacterized membrane protein
MPILTEEHKRKLEAKISALENLTSAEFKIIMCKHAWLGVKRKAARLFKQYHLDRTKERNAVLLLIVESDKELLIYGDTGIRQESTTDHWALVRDSILEEFKKDEYYTGLSVGIEMIAENLIQHFPADASNSNEVSNEIIFI